MDSPSKTDAKMDKAAGTVKETAGDVVGNERLRAEGQAQHGQGQAQEMAANVTGFVKGIAEKTQDAVKGMMDSITGGNK